MPARTARERSIVVEHPNRDKTASRATRALVVALLLVSAALVAVISAGGWSMLTGARGMQLAFVAVYVALAYYVARWKRGVLPVVTALAVVLAILAGVATPAWFARDKSGFAEPAFPESLLGALTAVLGLVQVLLAAVAMRGFRQAWHVEVERPLPEPGAGAPRAAAAA